MSNRRTSQELAKFSKLGLCWHVHQSQPSLCWQNVMGLMSFQAPLSWTKTLLWGGQLQQKQYWKEVSCLDQREALAFYTGNTFEH